MVLHGRIENGAVVLPEDVSLPEGAEVTIILSTSDESGPAATGSRQRVRLPLVSSTQPGTRQLTADRIAELLDEEDVSS